MGYAMVLHITQRGDRVTGSDKPHDFIPQNRVDRRRRSRKLLRGQARSRGVRHASAPALRLRNRRAIWITHQQCGWRFPSAGKRASLLSRSRGNAPLRSGRHHAQNHRQFAFEGIDRTACRAGDGAADLAEWAGKRGNIGRPVRRTPDSRRDDVRLYPSLGARRHSPHRTRVHSAGGNDRAGHRPRARIAQIFVDSGVRCEAIDDLKYGRWQKLVWNIPFNGLAAASSIFPRTSCSPRKMAKPWSAKSCGR